MSVYEMAKAYFPRLWDKSRLEALVKAGRLTQEEFEGVIGAKEESITYKNVVDGE